MHWTREGLVVSEPFERSIPFLLKPSLFSIAMVDRLRHKLPLQHLDAVINQELSAYPLGIYTDGTQTTLFATYLHEAGAINARRRNRLGVVPYLPGLSSCLPCAFLSPVDLGHRRSHFQ